MFADYVWEPGVQGPTEIQASLGFHAFKTLEGARAYYGYASVKAPVVFGEIALWGTVVEHEEGYRAEFASIVRLIERLDYWREPYRRWWQFWKAPPDLLAEVRAAYGVH